MLLLCPQLYSLRAAPSNTDRRGRDASLILAPAMAGQRYFTLVTAVFVTCLVTSNIIAVKIIDVAASSCRRRW